MFPEGPRRGQGQWRRCHGRKATTRERTNGRVGKGPGVYRMGANAREGPSGANLVTEQTRVLSSARVCPIGEKTGQSEFQRVWTREGGSNNGRKLASAPFGFLGRACLAMRSRWEGVSRASLRCNGCCLVLGCPPLARRFACSDATGSALPVGWSCTRCYILRAGVHTWRRIHALIQMMHRESRLASPSRSIEGSSRYHIHFHIHGPV